MRAEVARFAPGDVAGLRALPGGERGDLPGRLRAARPRAVRLVDATWRGSCPDLVRLAGLPHACTAWSSRYVARPAAAHRVQLPPAADRRQSVPRDLDLQPDRLPRAALGRALRRWAAPGAWCSGLVGLIEGQGGEVRCDAEVAEITRRGRPGDGRAAGGGRGRSRPTSSSPTPTRPGPTATCCRPQRAAALDRPAARAGALLDEPVRLVLRHQAAVSGRGAPHDPARARATASCSTTSSSARCWPRTSASTCTGRPRPTRRWRRRAATRSTCCRRCRTWRAAPTGAAQAEPYRRSDRARISERTLLPGLEDAVVTSRVLTPQDFQDRLLSLPRRGFGLEPVLTPERLVPAAQPERGGRRALPGRRRHPSRRRAAGRALVGPRPRRGGAGCRALALSRGHATPADLAACRELLRHGSRTFHRRLAPAAARVRGPAAALYAFCRLADDAVDLDRRPAGRAGAAARCAWPAPMRAGRCRTPVDRAFADVVARLRHPARPCRGPARGLRLGRGGPPLRDARRPPGLRRPGRRHGGRDDGAADGACARPTRWRAPATSASRCSSPTSPATSARTRAPGGSTCRCAWLREAGIEPDAWLARPVLQPGARPRGRAPAARRPTGSIAGAMPGIAAAAGRLPARHPRGAAALCRDRPRAGAAGLD